MKLSKTKVDKAGRALVKGNHADEYELLEADEIVNEYRKQHLKPLSETTLELQDWLGGFDKPYYIAQRLKRKPQIVRKLKRLTVRLSQLQDVGGSRIIVPSNSDVEDLRSYIEQQVSSRGQIQIERITDYRERGRDRTGYRALHLILSRSGVAIELQLRSRIQHYWAESIERTSVIYGFHLKEEKGDPLVLRYFQKLSDAFYELESGRDPTPEKRIEIDSLRDICEKIIEDSPRGTVLDSYVNEGVIKTLTQKELSSGRGLNNWIIVFDWNSGSFISWDIVSRNPEEATREYARYESAFPPEEGFEVVLIGSSEVATVRQTHSHYFGIESYQQILDSLDTSIVGFRRKIDLDIGARQILAMLHRRNYWGKKAVSRDTLKNHYCRKVLTFDQSLEALVEKMLVHTSAGVSLNLQRKGDIENYL